MKLAALSILGLALAAPTARAQNRDTSTNESSKSTAQSADSAKSAPTDADRPAAARSRDAAGQRRDPRQVDPVRKPDDQSQRAALRLPRALASGQRLATKCARFSMSSSDSVLETLDMV